MRKADEIRRMFHLIRETIPLLTPIEGFMRAILFTLVNFYLLFAFDTIDLP